MNTNTEQKHTPGPWWATDSGVRDRGGYICHTNPPTHFQGQDERYDREVDERKANKNLIAAAPELLEALEHYLIQDEIAEGYGGGVGGSAREQARAAIAKATGEHHEQ